MTRRKLGGVLLDGVVPSAALSRVDIRKSKEAVWTDWLTRAATGEVGVEAVVEIPELGAVGPGVDPGVEAIKSSIMR